MFEVWRNLNVTSLEVSQAPVARQQPESGDPAQVEHVRDVLAALPPLVEAESLIRLRGLLAGVAAGQAQVVQAGDCAEDPTERTAGDVERKAGLLNALAGVMNAITHQPVVRVGRVAGQYARPWSGPSRPPCARPAGYRAGSIWRPLPIR